MKLRGTVESPRAKRLLGELADSIVGPGEVDNELKVFRTAKEEAPAA